YWNFVRLSVGNNKLNTLSCSELPYNTYELDLSKNNISKIDSNCKHILGQIAILDLSCNQLVSNGINIQKDILEKLHFVVSLKLAGNNIAELQNPIRHFNLLNLDISSNPITLSKIVGKIDIIVKSYLQT
ncbi:hypothetical protein TrispH2_011939, partial [Trichoplax sp. H2]